MNKSKEDFWLGNGALILIGIIFTVGLVAILIISGIAVADYFSSPTVTKMRFDSGYTEMIQKDEGTVCINHPAKYEIQLDGENWVEVTEAEYAELKTGSHYRK